MIIFTFLSVLVKVILIHLKKTFFCYFFLVEIKYYISTFYWFFNLR